MWDYRVNLEKNRLEKTSSGEMARKLFLSYPTCVFIDDHEVEFSIRDRVRRLYQIPLSSVQIIGSAKTGFSLVKKTEFKKGASDLDLAIIDPAMFAKIWEEAHQISNGFEATKFNDLPNAEGEILIGSGQKRFLQYIQRGIIAPDFLPQGELRRNILANFARVTQSYRDNFSKISAFFYFSEYFFQVKQTEAIDKHWEAL
jgi:hypothetical protein